MAKRELQVVASGRKFNLRRDLRWVAKRKASFLASTRKSQKKHFKADYPLFHWLVIGLSLGQTELQVVASGRKFNLRTDLRWVAKRTRKFPRKHTQVAKKKTHFKADYPLFHWLVIG